MSAFASYASPVNQPQPNNVLPPIQTTGTGGSTYKYESRGGKRKVRNSKSAKIRKSKRVKKHSKTKSHGRARKH